MAIASTITLVDALRQYRLLESAQLEEVKSFQACFPDPKALAGELIRRGWLTPYQANQLFQGKGQELLLGSYILLERVGEGGMGAVFKAKNWKLGRVVALKLIRKERLDNPDAVRRFEREVRAAASLSHPNIVLAYDADQIGGTHLLVMEYIEGATDLAKLVKTNGPLPVLQACDFIRQAALGLQHAFERGMVHRDIKPANLLLTAGDKAVKILDMGLARLDHPGAADDKSGPITQDGAVMGTPDYIAPEQAMESHTVDIRGDLYSLGCTFYYLLTGRVPFPSGTLLQKLNKHQNQEAPAVEALRPDVPPSVAAVVRKLMAKKPEDRYQTPAEVAVAVEAAISTGSGLVGEDDLTVVKGRREAVVTVTSAVTLASSFAHLARDAAESVDSPLPLPRKALKRRLLLYSVAGGSFVLVGIVVLIFMFLKEPARTNPPVKKEDQEVVAIPPAKKRPASVDDTWLKQVAALPAEKQVEAVAAKLKEHNPGFDGSVTKKVENGVVTELGFCTNNVTDLSPVRALPGLIALRCNGSAGGKGKLADLSSLKDMKLTELYCGYTQVSDLSPLKDMKLTHLYCYNTPVSDLSPLKGMNLAHLSCHDTAVSDLSPLENMKLTNLWCYGTLVSGLSLLKGTLLKELWCDFNAWRDAETLRCIKTLETINGKPANEFWKEVEAQQAAFEAWCKQVAALPAEKQVEAVAAKLKEINPSFNGTVDHIIEGGVLTSLEFLSNDVTDLSPVRALPGLLALRCNGSAGGKGKLADLSPLRGMKLTELYCGFTRVPDLSPLKGMKLTHLYCYNSAVSDLSPLKDMNLAHLSCHDTAVSDLSPLENMKMTHLWCYSTPVSDLSPLRDMPLKELQCDFKADRDAEILRSIKTLEKINDKPALEFWMEADAKKP